MAELDLVPTGGRWGRSPACVNRLAGYSPARSQRAIRTTRKTLDRISSWPTGTSCVESKEPNQAALWQSNVTLNPTFFREVTTYRCHRFASAESPQTLAARAPIFMLAHVPVELPQSGQGDPVAGAANAFGRATPRMPRAARLQEEFPEAVAQGAARVPTCQGYRGDQRLELKPSRTHIPKVLDNP